MRAAERTVVEQAAVFAGEWHALRHALIDDVDRDFSQAMHVGFSGAEVAAFDRVVEESIHGVTIVLVILRGVDATLGSDGVRATGRIMKHEVVYFVAELR